MGVKRVGLQRNGTPGKARLEHERTRWFRRLRNWRVGVEARISHLKRGFGLRRTRLRRLGRRPHLGRAGDLCLQPAAHDRGRAMTPLGQGAGRRPAWPSLTIHDQASFRAK